jgi:putative SOS response-associated peptidase YedK
MRGIHDRMPVIIQRKDETAWLDRTAKGDQVTALLVPYPCEMMEAYPVSTLVLSADTSNHGQRRGERDADFLLVFAGACRSR